MLVAFVALLVDIFSMAAAFVIMIWLNRCLFKTYEAM